MCFEILFPTLNCPLPFDIESIDQVEELTSLIILSLHINEHEPFIWFVFDIFHQFHSFLHILLAFIPKYSIWENANLK